MTAPLPPLVDSHCHLTWPAFAETLPAVLGRMRAAGVLQAVVVATTPEDARPVAELCASQPGLYPTAGLHPNDVPADLGRALGALEQHVAAVGPALVAIGETGLDYYRDAVARGPQQESFRAQLDLARRLGLPVVVHIRDRDGRTDAYDDVARAIGATPGARGVIHCYTGGPAHAEAYLEAGFSISFSGILTFPKADNVRASLAVVPLARALVETDAPFLAPLPHRGQRNEPAYVALTCAALAALKGVSESQARAATAGNARALFGLPEPAAGLHDGAAAPAHA